MYIIYVKSTEDDLYVIEEMAPDRRKYYHITTAIGWGGPGNASAVFTLEKATKYSEVFWVDNEEAAKHVANVLARNRPGCEIHIAKTQEIYQSIPPKELPEVITKSITEKGVLPK